MKTINNYQRTANYLVKIFKAINAEYFNNSLDMPTITIQSTVGAYGHVTTSKVWTKDNGEASYELNMGADYLTRPIENVVATMIHEASHLYALQNGIRDHSQVYHNSRFRAIAEGMGHLQVEKHDKYGWTITSPTEDTLNFIIAHGFEDIHIGRNTGWTPVSTGGDASNNGTPARPPRKPSSTRKYQCPCCGNSFGATKDIRVLCMDCDVQFEKVS